MIVHARGLAHTANQHALSAYVNLVYAKASKDRPLSVNTSEPLLTRRMAFFMKLWQVS